MIPWPTDAERVVAGVMSGTSCDGIDVAVCAVRGSGPCAAVRMLRFATTPYETALEAVLREASDPESASSALVAELDFELGWLIAEAVARAAEGLPLALVASHGHTVAHYPRGGPRRGVRCTAQIGNPAAIAEVTRVPVVSDFRCRDVAAGGEGAPLIPYVDRALLSGPDAPGRAVANIGGISNVTVLPAGREGPIVGFDAGPGNLVLNHAARHADPRLPFDADGRLAAEGRADPDLLARLKAHAYFALSPPKSTGREEFGEALVNRIAAEHPSLVGPDLCATLTEWVAWALAEAVARHGAGATELLVCGGGVHNARLLERLRALARVPVRPTDDLGVPADAKEAIGFALLGSETMRGQPANVPSATGARGPRILGSITLP